MDQSLVDAVAALQIGGLGVKRMVKMLQATGFEVDSTAVRHAQATIRDQQDAAAAATDQKPVKTSRVVRSRCASCGTTAERTPDKTLRDCAKCRAVAYCSEECQAQHWRARHRKECGQAMFEIWRNPEKSLFSFGEPFSAWTVQLKDGQWFEVFNFGTPGNGGRKDNFLASKPDGYDERHLVTKECLEGDNWDQELDFHMCMNGMYRKVDVDMLKPFSTSAE